MGKKKRSRPISTRGFKDLVNKIVNRYGKVRIVSASEPAPCDCMCKTCRENSDYSPENRMRQITKNGNCEVSYSGDGYGRHFSTSCFLDGYEYEPIKCKCGAERFNKNLKRRKSYDHYYDWQKLKNCNCEPTKTVKKTVEFMLDHDKEETLWPVELRYGKRFSIKKKIKFKY